MTVLPAFLVAIRFKLYLSVAITLVAAVAMTLLIRLTLMYLSNYLFFIMCHKLFLINIYGNLQLHIERQLINCYAIVDIK